MLTGNDAVCDHGGRSSATPERTFPALHARAGLAELASPFAGMRLPQKSFEKNVLTPKAEIWYHAPLAPKQTKDFTRWMLCLSGS
jgi:hypothetical protein